MTEAAKGRATRHPGGLVPHIRGLLPALPPAEQRVARLVLADPAAAAGRTVTDLATEAGTSEATVIRFCRSVGVPGYPQLRLGLAAEARAAAEVPDATVLTGDIPAGADLAQVIATVAYHDARAVEETARRLDPQVCDRVVVALAGATRIEIYGAGVSGLVAADLQRKLHRLGRTAFCWPDPRTALDSVALLRPGDVAVGISLTGTSADVVEVLHRSRRHGATTVALTNHPRSPVTGPADHVLLAAARETSHRSGPTVSRLALLTVVDCLFVGLAVRGPAGHPQPPCGAEQAAPDPDGDARRPRR